MASITDSLNMMNQNYCGIFIKNFFYFIWHHLIWFEIKLAFISVSIFLHQVYFRKNHREFH